MPKRTVRDNTKRSTPTAPRGKPKRINELLAKTGVMRSAVAGFERRQGDWEAFFESRLPAQLRRAISHYVERDGTLTIFVSSAAWSARLRFALAECGSALSAYRPSIKRYAVRVQPAAANTGART